MEEDLKKVQPTQDAISYDAEKKVENDFKDIEKQVKKGLTASINQNKFEHETSKIYCKQCKYRRNKNCYNKEVLIAMGKFSSSAFNCDTEKFISIFEANKHNDCQFFVARDITDMNKFFKRFLIFILLSGAAVITLIAALIFHFAY